MSSTPMEAIGPQGEALFVEAENTSRRALDPHGDPYQTECFQQPFLDHPHHHHLICGHDIMTSKIAVCGSNCKPSAEAESKSASSAFVCPHPQCQAKAKVLAPRRDIKTQRIIPTRTRKCELSHVYGRDVEVDAARVAEKQELATAQLAGIGVSGRGRPTLNLRQRVLQRKRSRSPEPRAFKIPKVAKKAIPEDTAAAINTELQNDPAREVIMKFSGPGVRPKLGDRFVTQAEMDEKTNGARVLSGLGSLTTDSAEVVRQQQREAYEKAHQADGPPGNLDIPKFNEDTTEVDHRHALISYCESCNTRITAAHFKCFDCPDCILCDKCYNEGNHKHSIHHRFGRLCKPFSTEPAIAEVFCKCQSISTENMVLCVTCQVPFHPGCFGLGCKSGRHYNDNTMVRESSKKADYNAWRGGKVFECRQCMQAKADAAMPPVPEVTEEDEENEPIPDAPKETSSFFSRKRTADEFDADIADEDGDIELDDVAPAPTAKRHKPEKNVEEVEGDDDLRSLFEEDL